MMTESERASTATAYCWLVWINGESPTRLDWIAPCRSGSTTDDTRMIARWLARYRLAKALRTRRLVREARQNLLGAATAPKSSGGQRLAVNCVSEGFRERLSTLRAGVPVLRFTVSTPCGCITEHGGMG